MSTSLKLRMPSTESTFSAVRRPSDETTTQLPGRTVASYSKRTRKSRVGIGSPCTVLRPSIGRSPVRHGRPGKIRSTDPILNPNRSWSSRTTTYLCSPVKIPLPGGLFHSKVRAFASKVGSGPS